MHLTIVFDVNINATLYIQLVLLYSVKRKEKPNINIENIMKPCSIPSIVPSVKTHFLELLIQSILVLLFVGAGSTPILPSFAAHRSSLYVTVTLIW